jgi:TP901 family phage tail tape measure protein
VFIFDLMPVIALSVGALMVVLRAGASRVFFDVVGSFQATRLINDAKAKTTVLQSLMLDGLSGIGESAALLSEQMQQLVDATVPLSQEVAEARIEFEKFANFANAAQVQSQIVAMGEQFAFTADQALIAGARMAQLSDLVGGGEAVGAATQAGVEFGLIGGMETEHAMQRIINLQQQTNFLFDGMTQAQINAMNAEDRANAVRANSVQLLNQLNTVENRSAATMSQITFVMNQFAAQGHLAGDSITYMASASATLIEAGEEQGKAGRALRMMYARLGANTGNNAEILAEFGVATKDANGNLRSMEDIMGDLSKAMRGQSEADKMRVAQAIAGNDHYVRAIKLMENHERTLRLNTQAVQELDTAEEELARRTEDVSFQLKQAEARLFNARAALGDVFTPAVLKATNAQANLIQGLADVAESSKAFGSLLQAGVTIQQYMSLFAPLGEAYLNILSMNVSLQTQETIIRSLQGQDIARASAFGLRARMEAISLANLETELARLDVILMKERERAKLRGYDLSVQRQREVATRGERILLDSIVASKKEELLNEQESIRIKDLQFAQLSNEAQVKGQINQSTINRNNAEIQAIQAKLNLSEREKREAIAKQLIQDKENFNARGIVKHRQKGLNLQQEARKVEQAKFAQKSINKRLAEEEVVNQERLNMLEQENAALLGRYPFLYAQGRDATVAEATNRERILRTLKMELTAMQQANVQAFLRAEIIDETVMENKILANATREVVAAMHTQGNVQARLDLMNDKVAASALELATALDITAQQARGIIAAGPGVAAAFNMVEQESRQTTNAMMAQNQAMMTASGVLGGLSMVLSMFSKNEKAAQVAAVLMTASMIPATAQMFAMGKSMVVTGGAALGMATSTDAAAASTARLTAVMKKNPVILVTMAFVAIGTSIALFGKKTDDAADAFMDLNSAMSFGQKDIENAKEAFDGLTESQIRLTLATKEGRLERLRAQEEQMDPGAARDAVKAQADALAAEIGAGKTIQTQMMAESFLAMTEAEQQELFNIAQAMQGIQEREAPSRIAKYGAFFSGSADAVMEVTEQQKLFNDKQKDAMELAQRLPDEFRGAFLELATSAQDLPALLDVMLGMTEDTADGFDGLGGAVEAGFIGPIEAAKEAAFEFANAREEMFFGMSSANLTGDMVKQVVNKGVETLINTTEVFMTNTFNGMTTQQAANEIVRQVEKGLGMSGVTIQQTTA